MSTLTATTEELVSFDPATGEEVGRLPITPVDSIVGIVRDAHAAQRSWGAMTLDQRAELLKSAAPALEAEADRIGDLLTREMGKPLPEARGEVRHCAKSMGEEIDEIVAALRPEVLEDERTRTKLIFEPHGVCAAITPWNFPVLMPHQLVLPALVAGNTVVVKPSEETSLVAFEYVKALASVLPPNVLQIVIGDDRQGKALVAADVQLVSFVGSKAAGEHILEACGKGLKRVILELGGKDPLVVLPGADLDAAVAFGVRNSFRNAGQVCVSTERIYVDKSVAPEFIERFVAKAAELKQGAGTEDGVNVGPMISTQQKEQVLAQVHEAIAHGARALLGGTDSTGAAGDGNFIPPTVLVDVDHSMRIMRDETFGPVACIQVVDGEEEAVRLANDTPYGLAAAVFGETTHAESVAERIRAGMVGVNQGCGGASGSPWVGVKHSGYGFHSGRDGHRQFAQVRTVSRAK